MPFRHLLHFISVIIFSRRAWRPGERIKMQSRNTAASEAIHGHEKFMNIMHLAATAGKLPATDLSRELILYPHLKSAMIASPRNLLCIAR